MTGLAVQNNCGYATTAMITWDESKRRTNLHKHGIDLAMLADIFDFPMVTDEDHREAYRCRCVR